MEIGKHTSQIPDAPHKLLRINGDLHESDFNYIVEALQKDMVVLVRDLSPERANEIMYGVASILKLDNAMKLQAGFATYYGHRHNIGEYFMSVNKRSNYQFVTPHSEGSSFVGMQLASFYCFENSTDGGETILMNVDNAGTGWSLLRENVKRGKLNSRTLVPRELIRIKGLYQLQLPEDLLKADDIVLQEQSETAIPGLTVLEVLATPKKIFSVILESETNVFWDTVSSIDFDCAREFETLLRENRLLSGADRDMSTQMMDSVAARRIWSSGATFSNLFKQKLIHKLAPGELIIHNNLTWAHGANNWSPSFGTRSIAACFA